MNTEQKADVLVVNTVETEQKVELDPFAYLERNDFTSEKFKLEVRNLPKYYGIVVSLTKCI